MRALIPPLFNETTSDPHVPGAKRWSKIYNSMKGNTPLIILFITVMMLVKV